jgi:hypothetical protein
LADGGKLADPRLSVREASASPTRGDETGGDAMTAAAQLIRTYRDQAGLDADNAIELLVEFLSSYGMSESVVAVLCDHIDNEGMTGDLAQQLKENGLVIEESGPPDDNGDSTYDEVE